MVSPTPPALTNQPNHGQHSRPDFEVSFTIFELTVADSFSDVKKTLNFVDENKLQVFCRLSSQLANETSCITAISSNTLQIKTKDNVTTQFNFESIFEDSVKQEEVFDNVGVPLIQR